MGTKFTLDREHLTHLASLMGILAHPLRLRILDFLETSGKPQRVTEIVCVSEGMGQAVVSQQLKKMRDRGVLQCERRGSSVYYSLKNPEIVRLLRGIRMLVEASRLENNV